ncbi:6-hydroxy-D-nicotine oxidase [Podospora conica]|nr:6-hydroxy-D-nicotine oxidase [Schizothecium conicum]
MLLPHLLTAASLLIPAVFAGDKSAPLVPRTWKGKKYGCKCYYGDACWPSATEWKSLNKTVSGQLVPFIPPEAACHNFFNGTLFTVPTYNATECAYVTENYPVEKWINDQDQTLMWKSFTNSSCILTTTPSTPCTPGYYGVYIIRATTKSHIKAGIDFARRHSLRLVIRNTGHDFLGRSIGWGALIINVHRLQSVSFTPSYRGPGGGPKKDAYTGPAVTIGAGVQGRALLRLAAAQTPPVTLITGECPTVSVAGGFVQGAGHGPLTTTHGFAADNALSFDVVTASGDFVTANAHQNADLFYALRGGGPGNYAAVVSATFKTFPDVPSAGAVLYINSTLTNSSTEFWDGVRIFHSFANHFVDSGLYALYSLGPQMLRVKPFVAFNQTAAQLEAVLAPMRAALDAAGVPYSMGPAMGYATLLGLYLDLFDDERAGPPQLTGGWMFGRGDVAARNGEIVEAMEVALSPRGDLVGRGYMVGHMFGPGHGVGRERGRESAVNPRFRESVDLLLYNLPLPEGASLAQVEDVQDLLSNTVDRAMMRAAPEGLAYVNEANPYMKDWQGHFWGKEVYSKLVKVKGKWDPEGLFYSVSTPGTEGWDVIEYGERLCKKL